VNRLRTRPLPGLFELFDDPVGDDGDPLVIVVNFPDRLQAFSYVSNYWAWSSTSVGYLSPAPLICSIAVLTSIRPVGP